MSNDEKTYGMLCHLSALSGYVIPFGNIIGPLVIWLIQKDKSSYVDYHGKEALNFQISMTLYFLISIPLILVVIGIVLMIIVGILDIVFTIIAGIKANQGEEYRYPLTIRFVR